MAIKTIIKNSSRESVIKISGSAGSQTISLTSDILSHAQVIDPSKPQEASIRGLYWSVDLESKIRILRNNELVAVLAGQPGELEFMQGMADNHNSTYDIEVQIVGVEGTVIIALNKSGYLNTVETAQFSIYDDPDVAGA